MKPLTRLSILLVCAAALAACGGVKSPEQSSLFEKRVDPESGVVSYALKYGAPDDNRQSIYFTSKSMTEDGRFLVFWYTEGNERKEGGAGPRRQMLADLQKDKVFDLGLSTMTPFVETKLDYMVYGDRARGFFRRDFRNPEQEVKLCDIPQELTSLGEVRRLATHLTLTGDRKKAFLDTEIRTAEGKDRYIQKGSPAGCRACWIWKQAPGTSGARRPGTATTAR